MEDDLTKLGLVDEQELVLDRAALSLALLDHDGADAGHYEGLLADIALRLEEVGSDAISSADRADRLALVFAQEFGFDGDRDTYDDPDNADLIRVLDRRRGLPISLSILYVAAARRLGWTADVLDLPGHVLVTIGHDPAPVIVDPFRGGLRVGVEDVAALLDAAGIPPAPARHVGAMPNRAILIRLLLNQATRAEPTGHGHRALTLYRRMTAFAPGYAHAWWERARLELTDRDVAGARSSLTAMLEISREPELRSRISNILQSITAE